MTAGYVALAALIVLDVVLSAVRGYRARKLMNQIHELGKANARELNKVEKVTMGTGV